MGKESIQFAAKIFLRVVLATVLGVFLHLVVSTLGLQWCTEEVGYRIYELTEDEKFVTVGEYYFADGAPETAELEHNQRSEALYTEMSVQDKTAMNVILFVLQMVLLTWFIYPNLWSQGDWDRNAVNFGRRAEDKLRGFKLGLLVAVPGILFYVVFAVGHWYGLNLFSAYNIGNMLFHGFFALVTGFAEGMNGITGGELALMALHLLFIPAICGVSYLLGYKQIFVSEKLIYKNRQKNGL